MQPVTKEELKELIGEAKKEGKDTSKLEKTLAEVRLAEPPAGKVMKKKREKAKGKWVIVSTGPAREEDFEEDYE